MLQLNKDFVRDALKQEGEKFVTFADFKSLLRVKSWTDIRDWDAESFERLCTVHHYDPENMYPTTCENSNHVKRR